MAHWGLDTTSHPLAWTDSGEQPGWGSAAADGAAAHLHGFYFSAPGPEGFCWLGSQQDSSSGDARFSQLNIEEGSKHLQTEPNFHWQKYSCTKQVKVLFRWWENWRHLCVCSLFGEIILTRFHAAKCNTAAANNNTQRVFNGAHDHFKHESVFTTPLEDKGKVQTEKLSELWEVTKAACSKD